MNGQDSTKQKIIDVAYKLFLTKGYEETRISDIIRELDGLTKGAIYHYFDSKEDIFNAVVEKIGNKNIQLFDEIKNNSNLNASEKLSKIVRSGFHNDNIEVITEISPNLLESPKLLTAFILEIKNVTIPKYILPIIKEGVTEGSIRTEHPIEIAELIAILLNIWLNPLIFKNEQSKISNKAKLINQILEIFNIQLFDTDFINELSKFKN